MSSTGNPAAGTVTFGYFWTDRGFNVYHWMSPAGLTFAFYVNLAEGTRIEDTLHWRDLTVDILITSGGQALVLDEDEIPLALDSATRARIERTRDDVLARASALRMELEAHTDRLWPRVFEQGRRR
jgi:predicted RNA-binding protein associated with RNAse of E/G family